MSLKKMFLDQFVVGGGICWGGLRWGGKRHRSSPAVSHPLVSEELITAVANITSSDVNAHSRLFASLVSRGPLTSPNLPPRPCAGDPPAVSVRARTCTPHLAGSGLFNDKVVCQKGRWRSDLSFCCCLLPSSSSIVSVNKQIFRIASLQVRKWLLLLFPGIFASLLSLDDGKMSCGDWLPGSILHFVFICDSVEFQGNCVCH